MPKAVLRLRIAEPDQGVVGEPAEAAAVVREPANSLQLVVNDGMCTATFRYGAEIFELRPLSRNGHALIRILATKLPGEHPPKFPSGAQDEGDER